jgi:hypothetical protein
MSHKALWWDVPVSTQTDCFLYLESERRTGDNDPPMQENKPQATRPQSSVPSQRRHQFLPTKEKNDKRKSVRKRKEEREIRDVRWEIKSQLGDFKSHFWDVLSTKVNSNDICTCIHNECTCTINWHRQIWVNYDWYARIIVYVGVYTNSRGKYIGIHTWL